MSYGILSVWNMGAINKEEHIDFNVKACIFRMPVLRQWELLWAVCKPELPLQLR